MTQELSQLLHRRLSIIADHDLRDREPAAQLEALKVVSEEITAWTLAHRSQLDPQLRHYLANSSFQKALAHLDPAAGN